MTGRPSDLSRAARRLRIVLPIAATLAIIAPLAWLWQSSRLPASYSASAMGTADYGGGPAPVEPVHRDGHAGHDHRSRDGAGPSGARLITDLVADPRRPADLVLDLVTRRETWDIDTGPSRGSRSTAAHRDPPSAPGRAS